MPRGQIGHARGMTRHFLIGTALALALFLGWLALDGWFYLRQGYSLSVSMAGNPASIFHIDFPVWRTAVHVLLWVAAMVAIMAYVSRRRWASTAAWLAFTATLLVAIFDVVQYGTIGSPTSIWTVLLLLVVVLLTKLDPVTQRVNP